MYSGLCILKPPIEAAEYYLKLKVVLKWRAIYIASIRVGSLVDGLKRKGFVKWRGLKSQVPLYMALPTLAQQAGIVVIKEFDIIDHLSWSIVIMMIVLPAGREFVALQSEVFFDCYS